MSRKKAVPVPVAAEEAGTEAARLSGWTPDASERKDFFHRVRVFPPGVRSWRQALLKAVPHDPQQFPAADGLSTKEVRPLVDEGISFLREVARIVAVLHGTPRLGNKEDPVDELVYIILSRKTREEAYQDTFARLKRAFPTWEKLLAASRTRVEKLVRSGGLAAKKTDSLFGALGALKERFGSCTLDPVRAWPDEEVASLLRSLPEIEAKSAYCIMMYSLGRDVFPVDTHVGRVLSRLGPFRELGLDLRDLDHKQRQRVLADLIPPNLRYGLHVNLLVHGREICTSRTPRCAACDLKGFCRQYRERAVGEANEAAAPTVVDLFCGAGGLSAGFESAGYRTVLALDRDPDAAKTYRFNHPAVPEDRVLCQDIRTLERGALRKLVGRQGVDVLIGSPPCQLFSSAGFRSKQTRLKHEGLKPPPEETEKQDYLFECMVGAAVELKPRLFLMENVPGMQSAKQDSTSFMEQARDLLEEAGFKTSIWKLNAAAFGVPQVRVRYFLVAARGRDLPAYPEADYEAAQQEVPDDALPAVTLDDAIFDLPPREADASSVVCRTTRPEVEDKRARRYLSKFGITRDSALFFNHTVRYHNPRDLELYRLLKPGENSADVLDRHRRADLMRYRTDVFDDKYARLKGTDPCKTIVAHLAKDGNGYIHPAQARSLSVREAARVQSFHDQYVFCGASSDQWRQLGNAVPPLLAKAVAGSFKRLLDRKSV